MIRMGLYSVAKLGAALENFPTRKRTKHLVPCMQEKIEAKKCHKKQFVPPPKSAISTFDRVIISQIQHHVLPDLAT